MMSTSKFKFGDLLRLDWQVGRTVRDRHTHDLLTIDHNSVGIYIEECTFRWANESEGVSLRIVIFTCGQFVLSAPGGWSKNV